MNHPNRANPLAPTAAPPLTEPEAQAMDAAMHQDKLDNGYERRNQAAALKAQIQANPAQWGIAADCGMLKILRGYP